VTDTAKPPAEARDLWVRVGRVGRPHGLQGAFVVEEASEDPARFAVGARLYLEREPVKVVESKRAGRGRLVVRLDRRAERGRPLELPVSELPEPEEGSYYAFRLVGLTVEEEGRELGRVEEVEPGVANDVLRLDTGLALPFVEDCIRSVDLEGRRIVVAPGFSDAG
jgi:16S rRNA processing protein RimM